MGQQPNIELEIADLPRPSPKPDAAPDWIPSRPGELGGPDDMKWGSGFGTVGPDSGYALSLAARQELDLAKGEHRANANAAIAQVASARASSFGRAPTGHDIALAKVLLGYDRTGIPEEAAAALAAARLEWFTGAAHHPGRVVDFVGRIDRSILQLTAEDTRQRMAQGEQLIVR